MKTLTGARKPSSNLSNYKLLVSLAIRLYILYKDFLSWISPLKNFSYKEIENIATYFILVR